MMYEVHVFYGGKVFRDIFIATVTFLESAGTEGMIAICSLVSLVLTAAYFTLSKNPKHIGMFFAVTLIVPLLLLKSKTDVQIIDASEPLASYSVTDVPNIVAIPAHFSTYYMYAVVDAFSAIFHTVDDLQYSKTGMMYGAALLDKNLKAQISDPRLRDLWQEYLVNCINPDVTINNKYSFKELLNSSNIFEFLESNNPSELRRVYDRSSDTKPTCKEALSTIKTLFGGDEIQHLNWLSKIIDTTGSDTAKTQIEIMNAIENTQPYLGISQSGQETLTQVMAINGLKDAAVNATAQYGAIASSINYSLSKTEIQSTNFMITSGLWAQRHIPKIHTILLLLIICCAPLVLSLSMIPNMSILVLKNYLFGYFNIATWPIMFGLINFIMTTFLSFSVSRITGADGITFNNIGSIYNTNTEMAAVAGWLMGLTPFITPFIIKGMGSLVGSISHQFNSMNNGILNQAASETASGNISVGTSRVNEHSWNNTHANKLNTAASEITHGATYQDQNGVMTTTYGDGSRVYDGSGAISKTPFSLNSQDAQTKALSHTADFAAKNTASAANRYNESISLAADSLVDQLYGTNTNQGISHNTSSESGLRSSKDSSELTNVIESYAQSNNVSTHQAAKSLLSSSIGMSLGLGGSSGGVNAGANVTSQVEEGTTATNTNGQSKNTVLQSTFNDALSRYTNDNSSNTTTDGTHQTSGYNNRLADSYNQAKQSANDYSTAYTQERSVRDALVDSQTSGLSTTENLTQDFQKYLEDNQVSNAKALMTGTSASIMEERQGWIDRYLFDKFDDYQSPSAINNSELNNQNDSGIRQEHIERGARLGVDGNKDQFEIEHASKVLSNNLNQDIMNR